MAIEIKIPSVGESVTEALLAEWFKKSGQSVVKDEVLFVIETDKVTLEVVAEADGMLEILVAAGETVAVGALVGRINPAPAGESKAPPVSPAPEPETASEPPPPLEAEVPVEMPVEAQAAEQPAALPVEQYPSVQSLLKAHALDPAQLTGSGPQGRLTRGDVLLHLESRPDAPTHKPPESSEPPPPKMASTVRREPMSPIRKRIAERLLAAKQQTAMLTTFNEIDMNGVMALRSHFKEKFQKTHGVSLGFMSFFVKACIEALRLVPEINARIDGHDIVYSDVCHIGIAVGSPRGLVVPVIRDAQRLGFADIEKAIGGFVERIGNNRLEINDLEGGTFTISNGGVYGSLLSTPILNTPQSGILGMHKIEKRPVVVEDQIVIRPMMYVALSYDHRIVDGKGAVTFLKQIKACIENPERILLEI